MSDQFFAPFDSETGGTDPKTTDLLTFYMAITDENYKLVDEIDLKLKPNEGRMPVTTAEALKVNGIDLIKHINDPQTVTYEEGKAKLIAMLKKYHKKSGRFNNIKALGYNVPFDEAYTFQYLLTKAEWEQFFHYKHVDVMQQVDFLKEVGWFPKELGSLVTVVDYLQIPKRAAHNAKEDTWMCVDVKKKLNDIMKAKKDGGQSQDLISLLEAE